MTLPRTEPSRAQDLAELAGAAAARRTEPDQALAALAALAARQEAALRRRARAVQDAQAAGDPRTELAAYESALDAYLAGAPICPPCVCNMPCRSSAPALLSNSTTGHIGCSATCESHADQKMRDGLVEKLVYMSLSYSCAVCEPPAKSSVHVRRFLKELS